jgi:hypothetical protein
LHFINFITGRIIRFIDHQIQEFDMQRRNFLGHASALLASDLATSKEAISKGTFSPTRKEDGLRLPIGLIQPFGLGYIEDDIHAIAYFEGHSNYEAIEAMIKFSAVGKPLIRVILTRHDQSQIDYISDSKTVEAIRLGGLQRETKHAPMQIEADLDEVRPWIRIDFASAHSEIIQFKLHAASIPDAKRGGLTDPGSHSVGTSLPIMVRGRSTMAGPGTLVLIDQKTYPIPVQIANPPHFVGLKGFFTEQHHMGLVRAGTKRLALLESPEVVDLGRRWVYQTERGTLLIYTVSARLSHGSFLIECHSDQQHELISASFDENRARVSRIERFGRGGPGSGLCLSFQSADQFSISVHSARDLVVGSSINREDGENRYFVALRPTSPDWSIRRRVEVSIQRRAHVFEMTSLLRSNADV